MTTLERGGIGFNIMQHFEQWAHTKTIPMQLHWKRLQTQFCGIGNLTLREQV